MTLHIGDRFEKITLELHKEINISQVGHFEFIDGMYEVVANRQPSEAELIQQEIFDLKKQLSDMDYKTNKYVEGLLTEEEWSSIKAERQRLRDRINELENS